MVKLSRGGDSLNPKNYNLLIVDDDKELLDNLYNFLYENNFSKIFTAKNLKEARFKFINNKIDLIVLDLMLEDGSGFDFLKEVRKKSKTPVIILSALDGILDKRQGFLLESDDYIVKPFLPEDLLWRITAVLRRSDREFSEKNINLNGVIFNRENATLTRDGEMENLTAKQFKILDLLYKNLNRIVSMDQILETIWGETYGYENTLITHIYRLREKLETDPKNPKILVTVKGLGYKLVSKED